MTDLSTVGAVIAALAAAAVLAVLHLLAPRIRTLPGIPEAVIGSFAGGLAVAYVFLHLLPELSEGNKSVGEALQHVVTVTPLLDLAIFLVALTGFWVFYGLERLAQSSFGTGGAPGSTDAPGVAPGRHRAGPGSGPSENSLPAPDPDLRSRRLFRLHLGSFFVYNFLITYTMPLRFRTGVVFAALFTVAMGLHFVLTDRGLEEHYGNQFGRDARLLLALALLAGWVGAAAFAPTSVVLVSLLSAFLGGSILLNVFKEEIPSNRQSSFAWFTVGLTGYAVLLAVTTYFAE